MHVFSLSFSPRGLHSLTLNVLLHLLPENDSCLLIQLILNPQVDAEYYLFRNWITEREEKNVPDCQSIRKNKSVGVGVVYLILICYV